MAQFDLHRNPRRRTYPFLLDIQDDLLSQLATRVVVPLTSLKSYGAKPITRLNPITVVDSTEYVLVFQELAAIPASALGRKVASLEGQRSEIVAAIDFLFTGI